MPQNTSITVNDGATTPVAHVYMPTRIDSNNVATFQERTSGVPIGYPTLTWSLRAATASSPTYKLIGKITQPKVVTTTDTSGKSVVSVDYVNLGSIELVTSQKATAQERKDLRVLMSNLLMNANIVVSADNLECFW